MTNKPGGDDHEVRIAPFTLSFFRIVRQRVFALTPSRSALTRIRLPASYCWPAIGCGSHGPCSPKIGITQAKQEKTDGA